MLLSTVMMLDWLGEKYKDNNMKHFAQVIEKAVFKTFKNGIKTADLNGKESATLSTESVIELLKVQATKEL